MRNAGLIVAVVILAALPFGMYWLPAVAQLGVAAALGAALVLLVIVSTRRRAGTGYPRHFTRDRWVAFLVWLAISAAIVHQLHRGITTDQYTAVNVSTMLIGYAVCCGILFAIGRRPGRF